MKVLVFRVTITFKYQITSSMGREGAQIKQRGGSNKTAAGGAQIKQRGEIKWEAFKNKKISVRKNNGEEVFFLRGLGGRGGLGGGGVVGGGVGQGAGDGDHIDS